MLHRSLIWRYCAYFVVATPVSLMDKLPGLVVILTIGCLAIKFSFQSHPGLCMSPPPKNKASTPPVSVSPMRHLQLCNFSYFVQLSVSIV